jgi:hypothetical protein
MYILKNSSSDKYTGTALESDDNWTCQDKCSR